MDMNRMKKKLSNVKISYVLIFLVLFAYTVSLLTPLLWMLLTSFKEVPKWDAALNSLSFKGVVWIDSFDPSNYVKAYKAFKVTRTINGLNYTSDMITMFINSVVYAFGCGFFSTVVPAIVAYLCARYTFKFGKWVYTVVLVTIAIPIVGNLPAEMRMIDSLGLMDSIWGVYILKANFLGIYFLIFFAQFKGIPRDYTSAAEIDGASEFRIMFQIIFPLAMGTLTTVFLLNFINFWNDYQIPMIYWHSHPVVAFGLFEFSNNSDAAKTPVRLAGTLITAIPILIVFTIFNKKIMSNMSVGGIKG